MCGMLLILWGPWHGFSCWGRKLWIISIEYGSSVIENLIKNVIKRKLKWWLFINLWWFSYQLLLLNILLYVSSDSSSKFQIKVGWLNIIHKFKSISKSWTFLCTFKNSSSLVHLIEHSDVNSLSPSSYNLFTLLL